MAAEKTRVVIRLKSHDDEIDEQVDETAKTYEIELPSIIINDITQDDATKLAVSIKTALVSYVDDIEVVIYEQKWRVFGDEQKWRVSGNNEEPVSVAD